LRGAAGARARLVDIQSFSAAPGRVAFCRRGLIVHVIVATDGSKQSLAAARHLKSFADPSRIGDISVVAVIRPLAAVAFADELSDLHRTGRRRGTFREAAENAVSVIAAEFEGWGPKVHQRIRSGSPANEVIKAAKTLDAGLIVVASGSRGLSETVLLGSTAQRVQHYAPCRSSSSVRRPARRAPAAPRSPAERSLRLPAAPPAGSGQ
jgi:nucleotide-binding universal stress UspA family protein